MVLIQISIPTASVLAETTASEGDATSYESAVVIDIETGNILYEKNADEIESVFEKGYKSFAGKSEKLQAAVNEMDDFMLMLDAMGIKNAEIDVSIMRGHAYYTGIVFEFFSTKYPELPAVGGGGRYENLVSKFSKTKIIGVGASVGVSRLLVSLMDENKIDLSKFEKNVDVAVLIMGKQNVKYAMQTMIELRNNEIVAVPYLDTDKKFKNQIEYADKIGVRYSMIIGDDEVAKNVVALKNMETGNQETLSLEDAIKNIKVK